MADVWLDRFGLFRSGGVFTVTDDGALDRFARRAGELYSLPAVAVRVLELTAEPQVDLRALKSCIENDPALAAKVLRVVNSSLFGLSAEVRDLGQALALLGIKPLKLLVLGFSLSAAMSRNADGSAVKRYWQHTLTQAIAAREISERIWQSPGDEPFLAALLQDIGMLVLIQELKEPYVRFLERALASGRDLTKLEKSVLNFDYRELGARLLDQWALPGTLVGAINLRLRSDAIELLSPAEQTLPRILRLAELLADLVVDRRHAALEQLLHEPARRAPLTAGQVEELIAAVQAKLVPLADVFSCELPPGIDYRDVLIEAHRQISRLASEVAGDLLKSSNQPAKSEPEDVQLIAECDALTVAAVEFEQATETPVAAVNERRTGDAARSSAAVATLPSAPAAKMEHSLAAAAVPGGMSLELRSQLIRTLATCREARQALSVVLVEIDRFSPLATALGPIEAQRRIDELGQLCGECDIADASLVEARQACFALILPGCDRREAVAVADDILQRQRDESRPVGKTGRRLAVSVGAATVPQPSKNFRVDDLIDSASRCLSTAQLCGGNTLKSIGVY